MRALVTGGSGFIGFHVVRTLLSAGHSVRVLVRSREAARRLEPLGVEVVMGDLATGEGIGTAVAGCDAVFHVAAHYSLDRRDGPRMYAVNVEGTRRVLAAVRRAGGPRMVYTSSTATIGLRADGGPADESRFVDPASVRSAYKRSKILAENLVLDACREGMDIVIVNPSAPVGWGDVKPTPTGRIVLDAMKGRIPGYVETGLNVVSVGDVAAGHLLAWRHGQSGERYILGHQNMHLSEILQVVAELAGRRPPKLRIPFWVAWCAAVVDEFVVTPVRGGPARIPLAGVQLAKQPMYFTAEKAVRELGLPQTPVRQALAEAVAWFRTFRMHGAAGDVTEHAIPPAGGKG
ncbi:dihydroflavonol-4-reductase [Alicyclobacillus cellulosilyticus]|uniref:Dihydroflavonol-4-reductase n=1 Tax=Alicyclobacillus cellulosilyticus TaxID=1003997 RepID=A0A917NFZ9_9BACL|nr:hopanoid-associated sugar epimerase [Alicyclobacillus cellulosilyticus]GGI98300.1 dihydroflavonol-4-reductase [Alicyclobacillus cellulosilyticus]